MKRFAIAALSLAAVVGWATAILASTNTGAFDVAVSAAPFPRHAAKTVPWARVNRGGSLVSQRNPLPAIQLESAKPEVLGEATVVKTNELTTEQALDLVKPGVVSIIDRLEGGIKIADFDIDLKTFALNPRPDLPPHTFAVDMGLYGTGFIINSDGYAVTNAHVVSKGRVFDELRLDLGRHWKDVFQSEIDGLSKKDYSAYEKSLEGIYGTDKDAQVKLKADIEKEIDLYIKTNAVDEVSQRLVVVDQSLKTESFTKGKELEEVFKKGLPITVVSFDKNYEDTGEDVAVVQIPGHNMPVLPLGDSTGVTSGSKVFVLGYPYNAHIDNADLFEPTLTQGIVSSIKQYQKQKLIQLDNKASEGSSGSPLFDTQGKVLGVVTYLNGNPDSGDDFTYALPVELIKKVLDKIQVNNDLGMYGSNMLLGWSYQNQGVCKKAIDAFNTAGLADSRFVAKETAAKYAKACQDLIAAGKSKDSALGAFQEFYKNHSGNAAILSTLVLLVLIFGIWLTAHFLRHARGKQQAVFVIPVPPQASPA